MQSSRNKESAKKAGETTLPSMSTRKGQLYSSTAHYTSSSRPKACTNVATRRMPGSPCAISYCLLPLPTLSTCSGTLPRPSFWAYSGYAPQPSMLVPCPKKELTLTWLFQQQIMFTAHDAGHRGITGNFVYDTLIGAFIADFCCGLSIGWWKSSHNVHHLVTNMPEHDPDIQNIPMFSTTPTYMKSVLSSFYNFRFVWDGVCDLLVPYQKWWYYPIMAFARFNLYFLGWLHLCSPRAQQLGAAWWTRPVEVAFMCCYWYIFGYLLVWCTLPTFSDRVAFVLTSHVVTIILHIQITLSHWGMPTADLGPTESFPQHQLRTTMDVDCPRWLDWFHGGLQFQAVHHLFPRVPRHNLRKGQELVREFARKSGVKYTCLTFVDCNKAVLARLEQVSDIVKNQDSSLLYG
jgi:delta8-fatty-acid desaturase